MGTKSIENENVRKIQRTGTDGASYMVTIPKRLMDELGWREREKVEFSKDGDKLVIKNWEAK